jgi:hypothetical protein
LHWKKQIVVRRFWPVQQDLAANLDVLCRPQGLRRACGFYRGGNFGDIGGNQTLKLNRSVRTDQLPPVSGVG